MGDAGPNVKQSVYSRNWSYQAYVSFYSSCFYRKIRQFLGKWAFDEFTFSREIFRKRKKKCKATSKQKLLQKEAVCKWKLLSSCSRCRWRIGFSPFRADVNFILCRVIMNFVHHLIKIVTQELPDYNHRWARVFFKGGESSTLTSKFSSGYTDFR